jgi:hypothetical protein
MKKRDSPYENESMSERSEKSERMLWTFVFRTIALTATGNRTSSGCAGRLIMPASSSGGTQGGDSGIGKRRKRWGGPLCWGKLPARCAELYTEQTSVLSIQNEK